MVNRRRAEAVTEYLLILGLVASVFITMNFFIKRAVQGRIKDLSDNLISSEHVLQVDEGWSNTNTVEDSWQNSLESRGGTTQLAVISNKSVHSGSFVEDRTRSYTSPFVGSEAGMITVPPYQSSGSSSTTGN